MTIALAPSCRPWQWSNSSFICWPTPNFIFGEAEPERIAASQYSKAKVYQFKYKDREVTKITKDALDHHFDADTAAVQTSIQILDGFISSILVLDNNFLYILQLGTDLFQVIFNLEGMVPLRGSRFGGSSRLFLKFFHISLHTRDSGLQ